MKNWSFCAFVLAMFFQFTPAIKINPISAILKWVGKIVNADVRKDIADIQSTLDDQQSTIDSNEIDRIRWEVLDFANSCRNNRKHTKDEFQHMITLRQKYVDLLKKTGETNGVFDAEYEYIMELYRKGDFL